MKRLVVVGAGMATARLAEELVAFGATDTWDITVLGDEAAPPYNRILLSAVLEGTHRPDAIELRSREWYAAHGVDLRLGARVLEIDRLREDVMLVDGTVIPYDAVVLATGAIPTLTPIRGLVRLDGTLQEVPVGESGEIVIHGPEVFQGYWKNPEATAQAFIELDGKRFFRSGDMGRVDEDGYFFMTDRLKRMINASGFKVWPAEVEALMFRHPAIQEACIIAAKDSYRGETVKAVVVLRASHKGTVTEQQIIDWCRENMAVYKVPRVVQFVDALPKSGSGKVMWRALQEQEAQQG